MALERIYRDEQTPLPTPEQFIPSTSKIAEAFEFAKAAHSGEIRKTGEPFYHHPVAVAQILGQEWGLMEDEDLIIAALLHDVPEDNENISLEQIAQKFGPEVAKLVDGVTKVDSETSKDADRKTHKKVSERSNLDPKVALLKVADRLHNMRTLHGMSPEKQIEKSAETLDIYAPMAESLGLWSAKKELEDRSFMHLDPEGFEAIIKQVDNDPRLQPNFLAHISSRLEKLLSDKGITGRVVPRVNGYYSLHRKRENALIEGKTQEQKGIFDINDVVSFRVITNSKDDCYIMLGAVHEEFANVVDMDRFDEFIVKPRINRYSGIQTNLNLSEGATEIAFVTEEMERFNKKGMVSLLQEGKTDLKAYILKSVFSPDGSIMYLRGGATGYDYVYRLNRHLGANADAILVDGVRKPLSVVLPNSATVEVVITDEERFAPDPNAINFCEPEIAEIIEEQLNLAAASELVRKGRELAETFLGPRGILRLEDMGPKVNALLLEYKGSDVGDIYSRLGNGSITVQRLNQWLDEHEVTKDKLGLTTIRLGGPDRAGILSGLSKWIFDEGGNIKAIEQKTENNNFSVFLVITNLNLAGEDTIRAKIAEDPTFETWKVV